MKVFLDTNILLDYLLGREPNVGDAITLFQLANSKLLTLLVTDLSIANIAYITRKSIEKDVFYDILSQLNNLYTIIPVGSTAVNNAIQARWKDFEDALQHFAAVGAGADIIITNNTNDYKDSTILVMTAKDFLIELSKYN